MGPPILKMTQKKAESATTVVHFSKDGVALGHDISKHMKQLLVSFPPPVPPLMSPIFVFIVSPAVRPALKVILEQPLSLTTTFIEYQSQLFLGNIPQTILIFTVTVRSFLLARRFVIGSCRFLWSSLILFQVIFLLFLFFLPPQI